ncbi:MAG TPA: Fe-S metabolism protein SufE [Saprospirales bacterium]|nr:Fe-S metabolism protein SufE [Saprospirales bacterium]HAY71337.1 Fe-S metabolism protein SufE [Saprospirales bacterium]HRQ29838.1 SufE family protein [Saprospiraceae bacterium]
MSIQEIEKEVIEEFEMFDDWMDKYNYIIDLGKKLTPLDLQFKTEKNLVTGCQSNVWLHATLENGNIHFQADSDALIPKGIVAILLRVLSGHSPDELLHADMGFIKAIGLEEHLSPNRANGLLSMVEKMKKIALSFKAQQN